MPVIETKDKHDLYSLMRLEMSEEGRFLIGFLEKHLSRLATKNANEKDDVANRWGQGHIQAVSSLHDCIKTAREKLKTIESTEQNNSAMGKPAGEWI